MMGRNVCPRKGNLMQGSIGICPYAASYGCLVLIKMFQAPSANTLRVVNNEG